MRCRGTKVVVPIMPVQSWHGNNMVCHPGAYCSHVMTDSLGFYSLRRRRLTGIHRNPHYKLKMVWRPSSVYNGNPYTNKTVSPLVNKGPGYRQSHYCDVIMGANASQITSLTVAYSTVYSGADQRKHQSSASLAFVRGIHRRPVNSPHKWPVTRKMFPFDDVIMGRGASISIEPREISYNTEVIL